MKVENTWKYRLYKLIVEHRRGKITYSEMIKSIANISGMDDEFMINAMIDYTRQHFIEIKEEIEMSHAYFADEE